MHSTETALLKVQNELLRDLDDGKTTESSACWRIGMASLEISFCGLPHIWWIDSKWLKLKNVWMNLSKQSMVFPKDLSAPFNTLYNTS